VVRARELKRITLVSRTLTILRIGEVAIAAAGAAMVIDGAVESQRLIAGIGASLAVEVLITFVLDTLAAHARGHYIDALGAVHF